MRRKTRARLAVTLAGSLALALAAQPASASIEIKSKTLAPGFQPRAHDYVVDCAEPVALRVVARGDSQARIAKHDWSGRAQNATLALAAGQAVRVHTRRAGRRTKTYSIRCLPGDFAPYEFEVERDPAAAFYLVTPNSTGPTAPDGGYAVVYTRWGAPIWWYRDQPSPFDAAVLPDGTFVWSHFRGGFGQDPSAAYHLRRPNGRLTAEVKAVGSPTDHHDFQLTADGNYMLLTYRARHGVDTSRFNGDSDASVFDSAVQELTPDGELVREWSTADHIALDETPAYRWDDLEDEPYDTTHANAIELLPSGDFLISLRHTDAVYRVDGESGAIEWKLGGTTTPASLAVAGDPMSYPYYAQHDVRSLGHGEISVHDNGAGGERLPRVVRYRIKNGVATLLDTFGDFDAFTSFCCGSARLLGDHWLVAWGGIPLVAEYDARHRRVFALRIGGTGSSYRAVAIDGELSARQMRRGMDVQARKMRR